MYAIVEIAGKQFKVAPDQHIYAPLMTGEAGSSVEFDNVLLTGDGDNIDVGASGVRVAATVVEHVKDDKVIIFKKKRRKGYRKKQGHRQQYTKLMIDEILGDGQQASPKKKEAPKPEPTTAEAPPQESSSTEPAHVLPASDELTPAPVDESATDTTPDSATGNIEQDDLQKISGVGPVFAEELNRLGVFTYQQLADLSSEEIDRIDEEIVGADRGMIEERVDSPGKRTYE